MGRFGKCAVVGGERGGDGAFLESGEEDEVDGESEGEEWKSGGLRGEDAEMRWDGNAILRFGIG